MRKFLCVFLVLLALVSIFSVEASADIIYVKQQGENSSGLGRLKREVTSDGAISENLVDVPPTSYNLAKNATVFSFTHNGKSMLLVSEFGYEFHKISVYDSSNLTTPIASNDIFSTGLVSVTSLVDLVEYGNDIIIAGNGNYTEGKCAILKINPDTCEVVKSYTFGRSTPIADGDYNARSIIAYGGRGVFYAAFDRYKVENGLTTVWTEVQAIDAASFEASSTPLYYFPNGTRASTQFKTISYDGESHPCISYVSTEFPVNGIIDVSYPYVPVINSPAELELEEFLGVGDFCYGGGLSKGIFYTAYTTFPSSANQGTAMFYTRYICRSFGAGKGDSIVFDVGEASSNAAYDQLSSIEYDDELGVLFAKVSNLAGEGKLLAMPFIGEDNMQEFEGIYSFTVVPALSDNKTDTGDNDDGKDTGNNYTDDKTDTDSKTDTDNGNKDNSGGGTGTDGTTQNNSTGSAINEATRKKIAENFNVNINTINFITQTNIIAVTAPTSTVKESVEGEGFEISDNLTAINVTKAGRQAFQVSLPSSVQDKNISDVKIYFVNKSVAGLGSVNTSALPSGMTEGVLLDSNGGEITETIPSSTAIASANLESVGEYNVYLAQKKADSSSSSSSGGGCNAGFGLGVLSALAVFVRRKQGR